MTENIMTTPEPQATPIAWKRTILRIEDQLDAEELNDHLGNGWKLDPELPAIRLDNVFYQSLVHPGDGELPSIVVARPVEKEVPEALDGFMSIAPDDRPDGELAKYLKDGWVYVGYSGTKNLVQIKKPKTPGGSPS